MSAATSALGDLLARLTREGELYEKLPEERVRCFACGHRCLIPPGRDGVCRAIPEHEFLVSARAARGVPPPRFFVPASGVTPEFDLLEPTPDGAYRKRRIEDTRVLQYTGPVYNIEVEEDQTYLVHGAA